MEQEKKNLEEEKILLEEEKIPVRLNAGPPTKMGRPTLYNDQLAADICFEIATTTATMKEICDLVGVAYGTVAHWLLHNAEFSAAYMRAKELQMLLWQDELLSVAKEKPDKNDMAAVGQQRNLLDTMKFLMTKMAPKIFGDKVKHEHDHNIKTQMNDSQFGKLLEVIEKKKSDSPNEGYEDAEVVS